MNNKDKIEIARSILNNAAKINVNKKTLLKISQKMDQYIIEYYQKNKKKKEKIKV